MNLHNAEFIISAVSDRQYPKGELPELAMVGRSNVGKSSLINKILNRKNFAKKVEKNCVFGSGWKSEGRKNLIL